MARKFVEMVLPHSEADPAALLVHFLVAFGNAVGRAPHARVEADRHACNLYAAFVGTTGAGRKGTASAQIRRLFERGDPTWAKRHVTGGMSTDEGVIQAVNSLDDAHEDKVATDGVEDKRLLWREGELSRVLRAMARPGNTLSPILRDAWDGHDPKTLTKYKPLRAANPHISIAGDITVDELRSLWPE